MDPIVSIIVPAYNAEKYMERCIRSALAQTYDAFELIVINDGSTDATEAICASFTKDRRIKLINKQNAGVSAARNTGLEQCKGKYVMFLDADDTLEPIACEKLVAEMERGADLCIGDHFVKKNDKKRKRGCITDILSPGMYEKQDVLEKFGKLYTENCLNPPWAKCYRRDLIEEPFSPELSLGEDLIFNLNYLINCARISIIPDIIYNYYNEDNTLSTGFRLSAFEMIKSVFCETEKICGKLNIAWPVEEVDEKIVRDLLTLFEKYVHSMKSFSSYKKIGETYTALEIADIFENTNIVIRKKHKIEKLLLEKRQFGLFFLFVKAVAILKRLISAAEALLKKVGKQ